MRSLTAALVLVLVASAAQAGNWDWLTQYKKPNLHYGQVQLHPFYQLSESYDSNIYLVPRDQNGYSVGGGVRGSWITRNDLGLEAFLPVGRQHELSAGYLADFQKYSTQPETNDAINQSAHVDYTYYGSHGLKFTAGDAYVNTNDQAFSQLVERQRRWSNHAYAALDYDLPRNRFVAGVDASHWTHKYVNPTFGASLNRYSDSAGGYVGYKVQPKTSVYVSYHRAVTHYSVIAAPGSQDKNSKSHRFGAGLKGQLTPTIQGRAEAGLNYREYDSPPVGGVTRVTRNMYVSSDLTYTPTERTTVLLHLSRNLQESISGSNRFYVSHDATLDLKHKLPYKFSVGLNAAWGLDKYPDTQTVSTGTRGDRRDDLYQAGGWVTYDIQEWLTTGLSHVWRERNSTFSGEFNYLVQVTTWNLALKF